MKYWPCNKRGYRFVCGLRRLYIYMYMYIYVYLYTYVYTYMGGILPE